MRRTTKTALKVLAAVVGALVVVCVGGLLYLGHDCPPPDDSDLRPARPLIPDEQNAYYYFVQAARKLYYPRERWGDISCLTGGTTWDPDLAKELVEKNAETFELIRRGLACSQILAAEPKASDNDWFPWQEWEKIGKLCMIRTRHLREKRMEKEAFDEAMNAVAFGHIVQNCGAFKGYLTTSHIKYKGCARMGEMLWNTTLVPEQLRVYVDKLQDYAANEQALAVSIKASYALNVQAFEDSLDGVEGNLDEQLPRGLPARMGFHLHVNRTRKLIADVHRLVIENIPKHRIDQARIERFDFSRYKALGGKIKLVLTPNITGRILVGMLAGSLEMQLVGKCRENVQVHATRLLIAIRCYKMETGELPQYLDDLVPTYIKEIPIDDFDGRPMRYSREKKIVYSIGTNLIDDGGTGLPYDDDGDIIFEIDF